MSNSTAHHRSESPQLVSCAVITVSDTRTIETDRGGELIVELLGNANHQVVQRDVIPDEPEAMRHLISELTNREDVDVILMTGGTGISARDQTFETVCALLEKQMPGYGELFRMLSFEEIGSAAMLSRAVGGVVGATVLLTMPGSPAAVRLAMQRLVLPEIGHFVYEATR